jgi:ABC-type lipoprotein export system ATPase subunit
MSQRSRPVITHNPDNAALADRTIHIRDGVVVCDGERDQRNASFRIS